MLFRSNGGTYEPLADEVITAKNEKDLPNPLLSIIPLLVIVIALNAFKVPVEISILLGIVIGMILLFNNINLKDLPGMFTRGSTSSIGAITNTCAVVGFGGVVKGVPAFQTLIDTVTTLPGPPLVGAAIAVTVICGITGSASGGLGISVPIIGPIYTSMGVPAAAIHRVASVASSALDSMPHNGYIVTTLNICKTNHKEAYFPIFCLTVVLPAVATVLTVILFQIFPNLS